MSHKQHAPAPWGVRNATEVFCGRKRVCHVNAASREDLNMLDDPRVAMANARLIAAAPDLLEALEVVVTIANEAFNHWDADHDAKVGKILLALSGISQRYDKRIDAIHSAIAKATGETE